MESTADEAGVLLRRCQSLCMVLNTPKGRGVFAIDDIASGTVIDTCPVLVLPPNENRNYIEKTVLYHYTYNWPWSPATSEAGQTSEKDTHTQAVVFGLGSLFNHAARKQNVGWTRDVERQMITYHALRDIRAGEELCISYGGHLTFEDADAESESDEEEADAMLARIDVAD